ncbi:MAG: hypothetical protein MZV70_42145 [Desulfobacterales bacterium]|nr:hypothetical protein [Desulfobacterales bacterium]
MMREIDSILGCRLSSIAGEEDLPVAAGGQEHRSVFAIALGAVAILSIGMVSAQVVFPGQAALPGRNASQAATGRPRERTHSSHIDRRRASPTRSSPTNSEGSVLVIRGRYQEDFTQTGRIRTGRGTGV